MRTGSSSRRRRALPLLMLGLALAVCPRAFAQTPQQPPQPEKPEPAKGDAPPAEEQQKDFFQQASDYFKSETIEGVSKHAEAPTETPATVTILGREELERYGFRTVAEVLNFASLGNFAHGDRRYDLVGSRGQFFFDDFNTRILVMLNGHSLNEPWANFAEIGRAMLIPLDLVERIEIVYGPSSLLYGGYSLYGIVNVVTRTGGTLPGWRVRASGGSWRTGEGVASWGKSGITGGEDFENTEWSVLAAAGYYTTRGEDLDLPLIPVSYDVDYEGGRTWGGHTSGTDFERAPFAFLHARYGGLSFLARGGNRKRGAPLSPYGAVFGATDQYLKDSHAFGEVRWDRQLTPSLSVTMRGFHDRYGYDEQDPYADSASYPGQKGYHFILTTDSKDTGGELRFGYRRGTHYVTLGGEVRYRGLGQESLYRFFNGETAPGSLIRQDTNGRFAVLYAQEEWRPSGKLSLVVGGNWADSSPGGSKALPRLAVIYKPRPRLSIKWLYGRGFRPPSNFEAKYEDNLTRIANPALRSEEIASYEGSLIWNPKPQLSLQAYAFSSRLKGLIQGVKIESPTDVQGGVVGPNGTAAGLVGYVQYQSSGDVPSHGFGASLRMRTRKSLGFLNVAYNKAQVESLRGSETKLPASPGWLGTAGLSHELGRFVASATARYVGPQLLHPLRGGGEAGDFVELNLRVLFRTRVVYPVQFHLDVWNLFDTGGTLAAGQIYALPRIPIEGRRAVVGAAVSF